MHAAKLGIPLVATLMLSSVSGCATVLNVRGADVPYPTPGRSSLKTPGHIPAPKMVYGGVIMDAVLGTGLIIHEAADDPITLPIGIYLLAVDLPLSVVGDTLTLPITVPAAIEAIQKSKEPDSDDTPGDAPTSAETSVTARRDDDRSAD